MPKQTYAIEPGGPKRLSVTWKGLYKEMTLSFDDNVVGTIPNQKALASGQEFRLIDGSTIKVQLVNKVFATELQVLRNGIPLPGSASNPQTRLKNAYAILYFLAALNVIVGLVSVVFESTFLQELGLGVSSIIFGLVYLALGFFVQRRSSFALILAIILYAGDGILGLVMSISAGLNPSIAGLIFRVLIIIVMAQGLGAIKAIKAEYKTGGAVQNPD